jgi:predicted transcriptional regulator of viral defense system
MPEPSRLTSTPWARNASVRVAKVAERQWGVISRTQLVECGLGSSSIARWLQRGLLHRVLPGIYAVGHARLPDEARCWAAVRYAGDEATLSHFTAAWWWGLIETRPTVIHVSGPGRGGSTGFVKVHHPRRPQRVTHRGMPVTPVERTLRDIAFLLPARGIRRALSNADYQRLLDLVAAERQLGRGRPGAAALRRELEHFDPNFGLTRSPLEDEFVDLCGRHGLPPPRLNVKIGEFTVDAVWFEQDVAVELDGGRAHGTAAAVSADRDRDLYLRDAGFVVLRYSWRQVFHVPERVVHDLRRHLTQPN